MIDNRSHSDFANERRVNLNPAANRFEFRFELPFTDSRYLHPL